MHSSLLLMAMPSGGDYLLLIPGLLINGILLFIATIIVYKTVRWLQKREAGKRF